MISTFSKPKFHLQPAFKYRFVISGSFSHVLDFILDIQIV